MLDTTREPVSSVDSAWLRMDEPCNLMVVNGVMVLSEPVPFERYRDLLASRLLVLPRLRQRIVKSRTTSGPLMWEVDPHFDLAYHLRLAPLERADQSSLQDLAGRLMGDAFDPRRPLWQFHFVPHYEGGSAVVCRLHHCIGDGLALLWVLLTMTDDPPAALKESPPAPTPAKAKPGFIARSLSPLVSFTRTVEENLVREVKEIIARPARALDLTRDLSTGAGAAGKLLVMRNDPQTVFKGPLTDQKRAVWSQPIAIDALKEVARVSGSKINDVVLAAVAGGLRRYLLSREQPVDGLELRAVVPVNLRPVEEASELGNRFGLMFVPLPLGIEDSLDRIFAVRDNTRQIKRSPEALLTYQILRTLGVTPSPLFELIVGMFGRRATAVMTNVIGPGEPLRMAGTTLKQVIFWVPCSGHLGMGVSIFSYAGSLWVGIATDGSLVPDPQVIIDGFHAEMATLTELARQVRPGPPEAEQAAAEQPSPPTDQTPAPTEPSPAKTEPSPAPAESSETTHSPELVTA